MKSCPVHVNRIGAFVRYEQSRPRSRRAPSCCAPCHTDSRRATGRPDRRTPGRGRGAPHARRAGRGRRPRGGGDHRRGAQLHRRAERRDGRDHPQRRPAGAGRLPHPGRPRRGLRHPDGPGAGGRLPARPRRGPQRPQHGGAARGLPDRRPRRRGATCPRTAVDAGVEAEQLSRFAELVFAYIDELSAASAAGHTDELESTGRVRQRNLDRLAAGPGRRRRRRRGGRRGRARRLGAARGR